MDNAVTASELSMTLGRFRLRDVSFDVPVGAITGLIGPNGAGKTTTLRILLGLLPTYRGEVVYFGMDENASDPQVRARIGAVLDGGGFFEELTVRAMTRMIAPAYARWSDREYQRYMEMFALDPRKKIKELSRGMRAKYALVLALSHQADLLIMDEPTSGLDPMVRREVLNVLLDYMQDGDHAVLLSTHITSDLERIADSIILMDNGRVLCQENRDDLLDAWRIVKCPASMLTPALQPLLQEVRTTPYGVTAVTHDPQAVLAAAPQAMLERPAIDDIMAAMIHDATGKGGDENVAASYHE